MLIIEEIILLVLPVYLLSAEAAAKVRSLNIHLYILEGEGEKRDIEKREKERGRKLESILKCIVASMHILSNILSIY